MNGTKTYAFILGSNPALSVSEIFNVFGDRIQLLSASKEILLVTADEIPGETINRLGGTIKIVEVFAEGGWSKYDPMGVVEEISEKIAEVAGSKEGKFHLGISIYNLDGSKNKLFRLSRSLKFFYINIKKLSAKDGVKIAFPRIKERILSSASVLKNELMNEDGAEFDLILGKEGYWLGKTVGVQDIDEYSHRDIDRPERDLLSGTTPPKLAKIMINLGVADKSKDSLLLDPFCGSGTFIQEMKLLGFKNILGSDISDKAVNDTQKNLKWLFETYHLADAEGIKIERADALKLSSVYAPESIEAIISEVYLGPPLKQSLGAEEGAKLVQELSGMYAKVLRELAVVLKRQGRIVLALPIFKMANSLLPLDVDKAVEGAGFAKVAPPEVVKRNFGNLLAKRGSIIYSRPDQLVLREIIILEKQ